MEALHSAIAIIATSSLGIPLITAAVFSGEFVAIFICREISFAVRFAKISFEKSQETEIINILAVAYLLGSLHPFGLMTLDYDLHRADTTTPKLTFWSCRE